MPYNVFQSGPRKGQPKTLQDRVIRYLEEGLGAKELPSRTKYRKFFRADRADFTFVGSAGAVRVGPSSSNSDSRTDMCHKLMKQWEERYGKKTD